MSIEDFIKFSKEDFNYAVSFNKDEYIKDIMIRAANKAEISSHQLMDTLIQSGLTGVYNLGMQHMWEYLKGDD